MTDICDDAQAAEVYIRLEALASVPFPDQGEAQRVEGGQVVCLDCGEPVAPARLAANPTVTRCVECQAEQEHLRRQLSGHRVT